MFPAGVESVRFAAELADAHGSVEVRRRGGNGDELIVDIAVKAPDGSTCVDIRALRYADVESGPAQSAAATPTRGRSRTRSSGNPGTSMLTGSVT